MNIYAMIQSDDWLNEAMLKRLKAELRNRDRCPNGVLKATQLRFARLPNQTPSQSVAVCRSDCWERRRKGWCALLQRTPLPACLPSHGFRATAGGHSLPAKWGKSRERGSSGLNGAKKSKLIQPNPTKSHRFETFLFYAKSSLRRSNQPKD